MLCNSLRPALSLFTGHCLVTASNVVDSLASEFMTLLVGDCHTTRLNYRMNCSCPPAGLSTGEFAGYPYVLEREVIQMGFLCD
jgi:hypothetical protein